MFKTNIVQAGFTLIELLVTMAIVGILASVAVPGYTQYVIKANRAAAQGQMLAIASLEQQALASNRAYLNKADLEASGYSLPPEIKKYTYDIAVDDGTGVPTFTITFTPSGNQASDGALTLSNSGAKTPSSKW